MVIAMKVKRIAATALFVLAIHLLLTATRNTGAVTLPETAGAQMATPAVLVELFTSEGCSTCPPADKLLAELDQTQPIKGVEVIALSEHVDYWNHLGWKDPYSSADFSRRQADYARQLKLEDVYTPQIVVDGQTELVGGKSAAVREAIAKAAGTPKANVRVQIKSTTPKSIALTVQVDDLPEVARGDAADVMLAITESGLMNSVSRGENAGRKLAHSAVTRKLIRIGTVKEKSFKAEPAVDLNSTWNRQAMKAVVFVQEHNSRRVLGAAAIKFAGEM